jgi:hypothetical protein
MDNKRPAARVALVMCGALVLAQPAFGSQRHQSTKPPLVQSHQKPVAYEADGTPIATGAPRRLSALAVGGSAWAAHRETRGKRRHEQIARR